MRASIICARRWKTCVVILMTGRMPRTRPLWRRNCMSCGNARSTTASELAFKAQKNGGTSNAMAAVFLYARAKNLFRLHPDGTVETNHLAVEHRVIEDLF